MCAVLDSLHQSVRLCKQIQSHPRRLNPFAIIAPIPGLVSRFAVFQTAGTNHGGVSVHLPAYGSVQAWLLPPPRPLKPGPLQGMYGARSLVPQSATVAAPGRIQPFLGVELSQESTRTRVEPMRGVHTCLSWSLLSMQTGAQPVSPRKYPHRHSGPRPPSGSAANCCAHAPISAPGPGGPEYATARHPSRLVEGPQRRCCQC